MEDMKEFIIGHEIEIFWAFVFAFAFALLMEIIFKPFRRWREQIKKLKALYIFVGKSSSLKPEVLLEKRPFNPYYYERKEDTCRLSRHLTPFPQIKLTPLVTLPSSAYFSAYSCCL